MGGEKLTKEMADLADWGSPPRGRGKAEEPAEPEPPEGITPAWAGKSAIWKLPILPRKDHPRVGGEKRLDAGHRNHTQGSPPRGRGKGGNLPGRVRPQGITPAWAGKSLRAGSTARPKGGSPPRWRGKAEAFVRKIAAGGITPALAGKSSGCRYALTSEWDHPRVGGEKLSCPVHGHHHMGSPPRWRGKD